MVVWLVVLMSVVLVICLGGICAMMVYTMQTRASAKSNEQKNDELLNKVEDLTKTVNDSQRQPDDSDDDSDSQDDIVHLGSSVTIDNPDERSGLLVVDSDGSVSVLPDISRGSVDGSIRIRQVEASSFIVMDDED